MYKWITVFVLASCGDNSIPLTQACAEQASGWCAIDQVPGCNRVYVNWCTRPNCSETADASLVIAVDEDLQNTCLNELYSRTDQAVIPDACQTTWRAGSIAGGHCATTQDE